MERDVQLVALAVVVTLAAAVGQQPDGCTSSAFRPRLSGTGALHPRHLQPWMP
jgi:hypothetical protein